MTQIIRNFVLFHVNLRKKIQGGFHQNLKLRDKENPNLTNNILQENFAIQFLQQII